MKIALEIAYNGNKYSGFQKQKHTSNTIAEYLEKAIKKVANLENVEIFCAGRTDSKVHASLQIVHFESNVVRERKSWIFGLNSYLPKDISVLNAHFMPDDFHARFKAVARRYNYIIYNNQIRPAYAQTEVAWYSQYLNSDLMYKAAQILVGEHNFSSFRASGCQANSPIKNIEFIHIYRQRDLIIIDIKANAFLYHMVRNIVGSLIEIGLERKNEQWLSDVLKAENRNLAAATAKAEGLFLTGVDYEGEFKMLNSFNKPFFLA